MSDIRNHTNSAGVPDWDKIRAKKQKLINEKMDQGLDVSTPVDDVVTYNMTPAEVAVVGKRRLDNTELKHAVVSVSIFVF